MGFYFIIFIIAKGGAIWWIADRIKKGNTVNPLALFAIALAIFAGMFFFWIGYNLGNHDHEEATTAAPTAAVQTTAKIQK